jgi:hypothetical protein
MKKKKCPNCGKEISLNATFCHSCAQLGKRNHAFGKHSYNFQGSLNYCCTDCGNLISKPTALNGGGRCKSCSRKGKLSWNWKYIKYGKNNPCFKGGLPKCIDCGKKLSAYHVKLCKTCENKRRWKIGTYKNIYGLAPSWKIFTYKAINFKSSWEWLFAKWLDLSGVKWKYEPKAFELVINKKETTYTPDFYLPELDLWIEIKGWWRKKSKAKFNKFCKSYPKEYIKVVNRSILCKLTGVSLITLDKLPDLLGV